MACRIVDLRSQWATQTHMPTGPPQMQPKCVAVVSVVSQGGWVAGGGLPGTALVSHTSRNLFVYADYAALSALQQTQIGICHCGHQFPL